jgi:polyisoprenoid-binding protein YceI
MSTPACSEQERRAHATRLLNTGGTSTRWDLDAAKSSVEFRLRHRIGFGLVRGKFTGVNGAIDFDEAGFHGRVSIAAKSIDTGRSRRDRRFSNVLLDARAHPEVEISLERGALAGNGAFTVAGSIEIAGQVLPLRCAARLVDIDDSAETVTVRVEVSLPRSALDSRRAAVASKYLLGIAELRFVRDRSVELARRGERHSLVA